HISNCCAFSLFVYLTYSLLSFLYSFFFYCSLPPRALHSFPTRRSSDLTAHYLTLSTFPLKRGDKAVVHAGAGGMGLHARQLCRPDRKSTRLNSSHLGISYAVFCLKKKKN